MNESEITVRIDLQRGREQAAADGGEVIDLMAALKASVERSRAARGGDTAESAAKSAPKKAKPKSKAKKAS